MISLECAIGNASLAAEVVEVLRVVARSSPEANLNLSAALQLVVAAFSLSGDSHGYGEGFSPTDTRQMKVWKAGTVYLVLFAQDIV